jgi:hypothetical protein
VDHLLTEAGVQPANRKERRDIRRVLEHWLRHASSDDGIPALDNFDFASIKRDWSHRFLICTDQNAEDAAFVAYGAIFAAQLGLPETVTAIVPLSRQLPERYQSLFATGCENAMTQRLPRSVQRRHRALLHSGTLSRGLSADPAASELVKVADFRLVQLPYRACDRPARFVRGGAPSTIPRSVSDRRAHRSPPRHARNRRHRGGRCWRALSIKPMLARQTGGAFA